MAGTLLADTTITTMIGTYYDHVFLERLEANLLYNKYGEKRPLPENQGKTVLWHALLNPTKGYSVGEGAAPAASAVSARSVSATVAQYADLRSISDVVDEQAVVPIVAETVKALGYGAALTLDDMIGDQIGFGSAASTGVANAASVTFPSVRTQGFPILEGNSNTVSWTAVPLSNGQFSTQPVIAHIRNAVVQLRTLNAMPFEDGNYRGIIHPKVAGYIRADTTFATWMAYSEPQRMTKGKLGVIEGVLFEESATAVNGPVLLSAWSNSAYTSTASQRLFGTLIFGKGAYGVTKLGGKDAKVITVAGSDKTDPLNQYTLVGYKINAAAKILNPSAGIMYVYFGTL